MNLNFSFLGKPVFWSAVCALIALTGLLITNLKGRPLWYYRMQRALNRERTFYDSLAAILPAPDPMSKEGLAQSYFEAVESGVAGIEALSANERRAAAQKLRSLVATLQATHHTLVEALEPFSEINAKQFIDGWRSVQQGLQTVYYGGRIPSDAHTHCSEVQALVWDLTSNSKNRSAGLEKIRGLGDSVVAQDRDIILPLMHSILERCQREVNLISSSLRTDDVQRAIWLKEKYWFDMKHTYLSMKRALDKIRRLAEEFTALTV